MDNNNGMIGRAESKTCHRVGENIRDLTINRKMIEDWKISRTLHWGDKSHSKMNAFEQSV